MCTDRSPDMISKAYLTVQCFKPSSNLFFCGTESSVTSFFLHIPPHPPLSLLPPPLLLMLSPSLLLPFPPSSHDEDVPRDGVSCNTPTSGEQEARSLKCLPKLYVLFFASVSFSLPTFLSVSALITFCFTQEAVSSAHWCHSGNSCFCCL